MQTRVLLNLDKKYCKTIIHAKQLSLKGLIDNRCYALEAVLERRAIHKFNVYFFLQKIKSECKYNKLECRFCGFYYILSSAFHHSSSEDCKQTSSMQTRAFLKFDKKYCIKLFSFR